MAGSNGCRSTPKPARVSPDEYQRGHDGFAYHFPEYSGNRSSGLLQTGLAILYGYPGTGESTVANVLKISGFATGPVLGLYFLGVSRRASASDRRWPDSCSAWRSFPPPHL
jgi:hypothetical protein